MSKINTARNKSKPLAHSGLYWLFLLWTCFLVAWGAFVRASGSGDGCGTHWPLCHEKWADLTWPLQTWIEYIHRVTSGLYGFLILGLLVFCITKSIQKKLSSKDLLLCVGVFFLTLLEALIGAFLVKKGYVADDTSPIRAIIVGFHLLNTLILLFFLTGLRGHDKDRTPLFYASKPHFYFLFLFFFLISVFGSWASLAHEFYPQFSGSFAGILADFNASSPLLVKLRIGHPILALAFALFLFNSQKIHSKTLAFGFLFLQIIFGFLNLSFPGNWPLQIGHILFYLAIWISLCHSFWHYSAQDSFRTD